MSAFGERYSVRDANGDELYSSDVWAHAARYFRGWNIPGETVGAGIWDRELGEWALLPGKDES